MNKYIAILVYTGRKYITAYLLIVLLLTFPNILPANQSSGRFKIIEAIGTVNRDEISEEGLQVVSLWDNPSEVAQDGHFTTLISNQRPQKLSLIDRRKRIRALAIVLPQYAERIVFDAKSTAVAVLFHDPSSFGQSSEVENLCKRFENKPSFRKLVLYLKRNLSSKSLDELTKDEEYGNLLDECNSEIFGQDAKNIKNSLQTAQTKLQDALK